MELPRGKKKYKQKPKAGRVIRVKPDTWAFISMHRLENEPFDDLIKRLIEPPKLLGRRYFVLPEAGVVCQTKAEARGVAITLAVKQGKKKPIEEPREVMEIK